MLKQFIHLVQPLLVSGTYNPLTRTRPCTHLVQPDHAYASCPALSVNIESNPTLPPCLPCPALPHTLYVAASLILMTFFYGWYIYTILGSI